MALTRISAVLLTLLLGACAATGDIQVTEQKSSTIRPASTVSLEVTAVDVPGDPVLTEQMTDIVKTKLQSSLVGDSSPFDSIVGATGAADYAVKVSLSQIEAINKGKQDLLGAFAGTHKLAGTISITDNQSGRLLTTYNAKGESAPKSLFSLLGGYTFDDTVNVFNEKVLEGLNL